MMTTSQAESRPPVCRTCRNYYITHDPAKPYGCRALGFKSRRNPALVVFESSGLHCQLHVPKHQHTPPGGRTPSNSGSSLA